MSKRAFRGAAAYGLSALFVLPLGCKRSQNPAVVASASAGAPAVLPPKSVEPSRCQRLSSLGLTLEGAPAAAGAGRREAQPSDDEEADEALLPFGVDIGAAVPTTFGFAVAGLRGAGQAFVALLGERAARTLDLGTLHGDAETPALAASSERVVVALRSSDAAGFALKLGQVIGEQGGVEWGYELSKLGKDVTAVTLALSAGRGLVAYQGADKGGARLFMGAFDANQLRAPFEVRALEAKDAEMPRLVARPGGFWLAWVRALPEPKKAVKIGADAGPEDPEERDLLDVGLRVVEVAKLDERGERQGAPLRVGEPRRQLLLFDVAAAAAGSLLVAMRSDSAAPGAEGGALLLSEIGADGSVHEERLEDDELGTGAPVLLVDSNAKLPEPWLTVSSASDATRLGRARGQRTVLASDPLLGRAEVLALSSGHFLTQRARGRGAELSALSCQLEPPPAPAQK